MKESLTRKLGPFPAWAWLLGIAAIAFYYRKLKGNLASVGTATSTDSGVSGNGNPPGDPLVLGPGESAYDPSTGALVTSPYPGDSGAGTGGGADVPLPWDGTLPPDLGSVPSSTPGASPSRRRRPKRNHHRRVKLRKPHLKGKKHPGKRTHHLRDPKPRTHAHVRNPRPQGRHVPVPRPGGARNYEGAPGIPPGPQRAPGARNRTGLARPVAQRHENQRPVATHPAPPRQHAAPAPRRTAPHNPARPVTKGGPRRVARSRRKKR